MSSRIGFPSRVENTMHLNLVPNKPFNLCKLLSRKLGPPCQVESYFLASHDVNFSRLTVNCAETRSILLGSGLWQSQLVSPVPAERCRLVGCRFCWVIWSFTASRAEIFRHESGTVYHKHHETLMNFDGNFVDWSGEFYESYMSMYWTTLLGATGRSVSDHKLSIHLEKLATCGFFNFTELAQSFGTQRNDTESFHCFVVFFKQTVCQKFTIYHVGYFELILQKSRFLQSGESKLDMIWNAFPWSSAFPKRNISPSSFLVLGDWLFRRRSKVSYGVLLYQW